MNAQPTQGRSNDGTTKVYLVAVADGPFGPAELVDRVRVDDIAAAYRKKCGAEVSRWFNGATEIDLFQCQVTGYRFWRPASVAGDEAFYAHLSAQWPDYYRPERWEYPIARRWLRPTDRVLEVGCGRGFFLRSIEDRVDVACGLELNAEAIANKVAACDIFAKTVEEMAGGRPGQFDAVCSFQVLEHVVDPAAFLRAGRACLRPGGLLIVSTPNHESAMLAGREDPFDLPPHHMGHFSPATYRSIAASLDMEIEKIVVDRRYFVPSDTVTRRTRSGFSYRLARRLSTMMMNAAYRMGREPGSNILVVMRKPVKTP